MKRHNLTVSVTATNGATPKEVRRAIQSLIDHAIEHRAPGYAHLVNPEVKVTRRMIAGLRAQGVTPAKIVKRLAA